MEGNDVELSLSKNKKSFWAGAETATYGFNGERFWGPTLVLNRDEAVKLRVRNELDEPTTVHWHGLHLPQAMDGGPHQLIQPGETWTSTFTVRNRAAQVLESDKFTQQMLQKMHDCLNAINYALQKRIEG